MAQSGDLVYYASRNGGFDVIDLQTPTTPQVIGHIDLSESNNYADMAIDNDVAYIAGTAGVQMVDISNPENPQLIGWLTTDDDNLEWARTIRVSGNMAFVVVEDEINATGPPYTTCTLYAIEISDLSDCRILGSIILPNYYQGFEIQDGLALYSYNNGLMGIDIGNPEFLEVTDNIEMDETGIFCVFGQTVFLVGSRGVGSHGQIYTITISDPWNMRIDSQMSFSPDLDYSSGITVSGSSLFILTYAYIWKLDIDEPANIRIVGNVSTSELVGSNGQMYIRDDLAIITKVDHVQDIGEFYVIDMEDMEDPSARLEGIAGALMVPNANELILDQDRMFVSQGSQGMSIIDVFDPEQLKRIDDQSISEPVSTMVVSSDTLYVSFEDSIRAYSVLDPQHPVLLSSLDLPDENVRLLAVMDTVLFAGANTCESGCWNKDDCYYSCDNYLRTIDAGSPNLLSLIDSVPLEAQDSTGLIISNQTGYLAGYSTSYVPGYGMVDGSVNRVVNLSDPFHPTIISHLIDGSLMDQGISNHNLFITTEPDDFYGISESWLVALDVNDPLNVEEISRISIPSGHLAALDMNTVYLLSFIDDAESNERILTISEVDVSNSSNMRFITKMPFPIPFTDMWDIKDMIIHEDLAYLALVHTGVVIIPVPLEAKSVRVDSSSRISATLPGPRIPGDYTIKVIDESGNETTVGTVTFIR
jgi:hypothetical protein